MIVGLETPDGGHDHAPAGSDRSRPARKVKLRRDRGREVQIVFQDPVLQPRPAPDGGLGHRWRCSSCTSGKRCRSQRARVRELGELVGLDERQMHALPRVAVGRPAPAGRDRPRAGGRAAVLILDESVAALDVSIQAQVLNLLADIRDQTGISYVLISHDLAVVRQLTTQIVVMRRGKIVERGLTAEVLDDPQQQYTQLLRASVPGPGWKPTRGLRAGMGEENEPEV